MKGAFPGLTCAKCWRKRNQKGPHSNLWRICLAPSSPSWSKGGLDLHRAFLPTTPALLCPAHFLFNILLSLV